MEQGPSRDSYETFRTGYFDCDYAHEHDGTFVTDTPQHKCFMVWSVLTIPAAAATIMESGGRSLGIRHET